MATRFNPFDSEFLQDPYPVYAALRSEAAVARVRIGPRQMLAIVIALIRIQREQGLSLRDVAAVSATSNSSASSGHT